MHYAVVPRCNALAIQRLSLVHQRVFGTNADLDSHLGSDH